MKDLVGIDLKSDYIKIVQLKKTGKKIKLFRAAVVETPVDSVHSNLIVDFEKISFVLSRLFKEYSISSTNVALAVSDRTIMAQISKYPAMPKEETLEVIKGEAEQYSHFAGKEIILDFCNIQEITEGSFKKINLFWTVTSYETIFSLQKALHSTLILKSFNTAGFLKFMFCEPTCLAFLRSVRRTIPADSENEVTVCICLNDTTTDMLALQAKDKLIFIRSLYTGRVDFEKFIKPGEDLTLMNPVPTTLSNLVAELQRSLSFLAKQIPAQVVIKNVLLGGSIQYLKRIDDFMTRELKITVKTYNPFDEIHADKEFFSSVFLEQFGDSLTPAIGLALRGEVDNKIDVNLVPPRESATIALEQMKNLAVPLCVLIILIFLCITVWLSINVSQVKKEASMFEKENKLLETQINKLGNLRKVKQQQEDKLKSTEEFKKSTISGLKWTELLNTLSSVSNSTIWLTSLDISNTRVVSFSGSGLSHVSISEFMSELNNSAYFRDCNLIETSNVDTGDKTTIKFTIIGFLK